MRNPLAHITPAEFRVLFLRALCGYSTTATARTLNVSPQSVEAHWNAVRRKLRLGPNAQGGIRVMALADRFA